jgi:class 3 adenylate cyclase/ligand-binding sensor domain-containing protein
MRLSAQDFLMQHFTGKQMQAHPLMWDATEDKFGRIWFANNDGIIRFDGNNWTTFPTPHPVRSIAFNNKQELFVACMGDLGTLVFKADGTTEYTSLKNKLDLATINHNLDGKLLLVNGVVYFHTSTHLIKLTMESGEPKLVVTDIGPNLGCVSDGNTLYVNAVKNGLNSLVSGKLTPVSNGYLLSGKQISTSIATPKGCLIATGYDGMYILNNHALTLMGGAIHQFATKGIAGITELTNGDIAVATFHDGVKIFNRSGLELHTLQLPSNETYHIHTDHEQNIWVGQFLGLSHALVNVPIQALPNLTFSGFATDIQSINHTLYLATSGGLYTLLPEANGRFQLTKKMNGECWSLLPFDDKLLIASTDGLFELSNGNIHPIIQNESFVSLQLSNFNHSVFAFGEKGCVRLTPSNGSWTIEKITHSLQQSLYETKENYWIGSYYDGLSIIAKAKSALPRVPTELADGEVKVRLKDGNPLFQSADKVYTLDNQTLVENQELGALFKDSRNNILYVGDQFWLFTKTALKHIIQNKYEEQSAAYAISGKPTAVYEQGKNLWAAFEDKLYLIQPTLVNHSKPTLTIGRLMYGKNHSGNSGFFIDNNLRLLTSQETAPEIPFDESTIHIEFALSSFINPEKNQYRYQLEGLNEEWSEWQPESFLDLQGLSGGKYKLHVQGKDAYGALSDELKFAFYVKPPFYLSGYAYLLYACGFVLLIALLAYLNGRRLIAKNNQLEKVIGERTQQLEFEKKKSDDLLLNILPIEVANELKSTGETQAKQYKHVSVLFTDFVNFTGISSKLTPSELIADIHFHFKAFDEIVEANGVEKIKTIGDAYMAACGLPNPSKDHAAKLIRAAKQMQQFMAELKESRIKENKIYFDIRIGINSGPVVAGVVGKKKFAYDIWGDTVNVASRMESNSEAGKINISGSTYELVKNEFECKYRGQINAKNKGEIDMYFVN